MKNYITKELIEKVCPNAQTIEEFYTNELAEIESVCEVLSCDRSEYFLTSDEYELLSKYNNDLD